MRSSAASRGGRRSGRHDQLWPHCPGRADRPQAPPSWSRVARGAGLDAARGRRADAGQRRAAASAPSAAAGWNAQCIDLARALLASGGPRTADLDIPLGPQLGQCCGGRVTVSLDAAPTPPQLAGARAPRDGAKPPQSCPPVADLRRRPCRPGAGAGAGAAALRASRWIDDRADEFPADCRAAVTCVRIGTIPIDAVAGAGPARRLRRALPTATRSITGWPRRRWRGATSPMSA